MSSYSEGQTHQLMNALERADFTAGEITKLAQDGEFLKSVRLALKGPLTFTRASLSIWKTIQIESWIISAVEDELKRRGFHISNGAGQVLSKVKPGEPREVNLVRMTLEEMGFSSGNLPKTIHDIFGRIEELGGKLCPATVGPYLRLDYKDQPGGEWLWIAMEPINTLDDLPQIFLLGCGRNSELLLYTHNVHPSLIWELDYQIVFVAS